MACVVTVISRAALLALAFAGCSSGDAVTQPFPFNHAVHVEADVDCLQCHEGVLDAEEYRLPPLETCMDCHSDDANPAADANNPLLQRLQSFAKSGQEFRWDPALRLEDHVFFSHIRHVDVAEMECAECHGDMPKRTAPPPERRTITMRACIACHEKNSDRPSAKRATKDCSSCHR